MKKKAKFAFLTWSCVAKDFFSSISYFILLHPESSSIVWEGLRWLQHKNHLLDHILFLETFCCCWRAKLSSLFETNQKRRKSSAQSASSGGGQYRTGIKHKITKSTAGRVEGLNSSEHTTVNIWHLLPWSDWQIPKGAKQPAVVKLSIFFFAIFCKSTFLAGTVAFNLPRRGLLGQCHSLVQSQETDNKKGKNCKRQCENVTMLGWECA